LPLEGSAAQPAAATTDKAASSASFFIRF